MKLVMVHLSDIHIDEQYKNTVLSKAAEISRATYQYLPGATRVVLLVSGDVAYSGLREQYGLAEEFFAEVAADLRRESGVEVSLFVVPGNHDCDFGSESQSRTNNVQLLQSKGVEGIDDSVISACTVIQKEFFAFQASVESADADHSDQLWHELRISDGECSVVLEGMNISWVSKIREDPGRMLFPFERYVNRKRDPKDVHVLVMHHPINWFNQNIYASYRRFLRSRATMVISGHEHISSVTEIDDVDAGPSVAIEGHVLQEHKGNLSGTGFNVIEIDTSDRKYQVHRLEYRSGGYVPRDEAAWHDYRPLPEKVDSVGALRKEFLDRVLDAGAYLVAPGRDQITLPDIYVYPDMLAAKQLASNVRQLSNSSIFQNLDELKCGVLISGDERSGRTSLLYQLYLFHHARGKFPVLVDGSKISSAHGNDIDQLVRRAVAAQYEKAAADKFAQHSRFDKVLFVDNFDYSPIKDKATRAAALNALKQRFEHAIVTVSSSFEMEEALGSEDDERLKDLRHFHLQAFGSVKRGQLINRWLSLGAGPSIDEGEAVAKYHEAERLLNSVMDSSLIPHSPLYLLTALHSVRAGKSAELENSALGHYYLVLLATALQEAGVRSEKLDDYIQYCTYLAWRYHEKGSRLLSRNELREFNEEFSRDWMTVEFEKFLSILLAARVLTQVGEDFEFRYPYIYFYLKGRYLSRHLDDDAIKQYVADCCDHLYVRENANTILFLAHHASNNAVVEQVSRVLDKLFDEVDPVRFEKDVDGINAFIFESPKQIFDSSHSPKDHREKIAEDEDRRPHSDGLREQKEEGDAISLQSRLIMLSKTTEILGQIMKAQYARIPRSKKRELVGAIFDGNMRALGGFFNYMVANSERLFARVRASMVKRRKDASSGEAAARRMVSDLIELIAFGLVASAAGNATSADLREDVESFVQSKGVLANRIIELASLLDSASDFPRRKLAAIHEDTKGNPLAARVVQDLVFNRLYMFKTSQSDMRWLHEELGIPIKFQQNVSYAHAAGRIG
jgi:UDP-2,3-diacylglucosamine pyrophosphatase LpxH